MTDYKEEKTPFSCTCPMCGKETIVEAYWDEWCSWQEGELAQNAFPDLSPAEREVFISGLCYDCQKRVFGE